MKKTKFAGTLCVILLGFGPAIETQSEPWAKEGGVVSNATHSVRGTRLGVGGTRLRVAQWTLPDLPPQ